MAREYQQENDRNTKKDKDGEIMFTTKMATPQEILLEEMRKYILHLTEMGNTHPDLMKKDSIDALKRTGVLSEDGTKKDKIVSWE